MCATSWPRDGEHSFRGCRACTQTPLSRHVPTTFLAAIRCNIRVVSSVCEGKVTERIKYRSYRYRTAVRFLRTTLARYNHYRFFTNSGFTTPDLVLYSNTEALCLNIEHWLVALTPASDTTHSSVGIHCCLSLAFNSHEFPLLF